MGVGLSSNITEENYKENKKFLDICIYIANIFKKDKGFFF